MGFFDFLKRRNDANSGKDLAMAGNDLAEIALSYSDDKVINNFIIPPLEGKDFLRFKLGIAVVNIIMATWVINNLVINKIKVNEIVESMRYHYNKVFDKIFLGNIYVGDFIINKEEFTYLQEDWKRDGVTGVTYLTGTSYGTLLQTIYTYRRAYYIDALDEELKIILEGREAHPNKVPMGRVARKLCYHVFANEETLWLPVCFLLNDVFMQLTPYCKTKIH